MILHLVVVPIVNLVIVQAQQQQQYHHHQHQHQLDGLSAALRVVSADKRSTNFSVQQPEPKELALRLLSNTTTHLSHGLSDTDKSLTETGDNSEQVPVYMQHMTVILVMLHLSVFITGLVGNSLVCLSVYRNKSLQTVTNYYIVNLAVADFLVILICLPPTVYWDLTLTWNFGLILCKLVLYLQSTSVSVSVLTLTCISVDRWYAICKPLEFCSTKHRAKITIGFIWLVSLVIASPDVMFLTTRPLYEENNYIYMDCTYSWPESSTKIYQLCIVTLLFVGPFVLMSISYSHIVNVLWRNETMADSVEYSCQPIDEEQQFCHRKRNESTSLSQIQNLNQNQDSIGSEAPSLRGLRPKSKFGQCILFNRKRAPTTSKKSHRELINKSQVSSGHHHHHPNASSPGALEHGSSAMEFISTFHHIKHSSVRQASMDADSSIHNEPSIPSKQKQQPATQVLKQISQRANRASTDGHLDGVKMANQEMGAKRTEIYANQSVSNEQIGSQAKVGATTAPAAAVDAPMTTPPSLHSPRHAEKAAASASASAAAAAAATAHEGAPKGQRLTIEGPEKRSFHLVVSSLVSGQLDRIQVGPEVSHSSCSSGQPIAASSLVGGGNKLTKLAHDNKGSASDRGSNWSLKCPVVGAVKVNTEITSMPSIDANDKSGTTSLEQDTSTRAERVVSNCCDWLILKPFKRKRDKFVACETSRRYQKNLANYAAKRDRYRESASAPRGQRARLESNTSTTRNANLFSSTTANCSFSLSEPQRQVKHCQKEPEQLEAGQHAHAPNRARPAGRCSNTSLSGNQLNQAPILSQQSRFYKLIESRKKAAKMLIVIVIMFGLCYLPIHFLNTLRYTTGLPQNDITTIASLVSHWLCYFNSAVNPLIYNLMSGKFRHEFANLFFCKCFRMG